VIQDQTPAAAPLHAGKKCLSAAGTADSRHRPFGVPVNRR
jgi:hypothetical protein